MHPLAKKVPKFWHTKTPTVIQMEAVECGAAALSIILRHFKKYVPLEELRYECGVSRDGSNALNIVHAAERYGLEGSGYKMELEELLEEVEEPVIVFWEFNHFLVIEGFAKDRVYINDPASGPRWITYEELDRGYTGIFIHFEKTDAFVKSGKPPNIFQMLHHKLKSSIPPINFLILIGLCLLIPGLAIPSFTKLFIDDILIPQDLAWAPMFILAMFIAFVMTVVLQTMQQYFLNRLHTRLSSLFSSEFMWHMLRLPVSFYAQRFSGEISYRMTLNDQVSSSLTGSLATTAINLLLVIFYGAVMFSYNVLIASIGVVAALLNAGVMYLIARARQDAYARMQQDIGKSFGFSISALSRIESIKASGMESSVFERWSGYYAKTVNAIQEIGKKDIILGVTPVFLQSLAILTLLIVGGYKIIEGDLTPGGLMALQTLMISFLTPINTFVNFAQLIQNIKVDIARLQDVLQNPLDSTYHSIDHKRSTDPLTGIVEFRNVSFGYAPHAPPLIENLSFSLYPGKRIALVGPTGSGKSTVAQLASGLFHPWEGEILFNGKAMTEIEPTELHKALASIDQEIFIFYGTVRNNLTLWDHSIPEDIMVKAAHDACIHEEILEKEQGYNTILSEGGENISGGQRQRIEIARALIKNPKILIMDEATSAVDSEMEKKINHNVRARGCSAIMIAHRLSTIQDCDEIIVLSEGKVIERGTHEELKALNGKYKELIESETFTPNS